MFSGIDEQTLAELSDVFEERCFSGGELLCEEGTAGDEFYLIIEGQATVSKIVDRQESQEKVLAVLLAGDFFGEMALLEDKPRSANVRAAGPTRVFVLTRSNFQMVLEKASETASRLLFGIIQTLIARLRRTSTELVALYDTGRALGALTELKALTSRIVERLVETMGFELGLMVLENPYSGGLEVAAVKGGDSSEVASWNLQKDAGLLKELFEHRRPFLFNSFSLGDGRDLHGFERPRMLGAPLVSGEQVIGAVVLASPLGEQTLDMNHLNLVLGVAMQVATAIENARRREEEEARQRHQRHFVRF